MASLNKVMLIGNLGADPEQRYLPSGEAVTNIRIATSESWKDKTSGEKKEATEWHRVTFFGRLAEVAADLMKKGSQVYVEGQLRTRKYTDVHHVERYATEIRADKFQLLGPRGDRPEGPAREPATAGAAKPAAKKPAGKFDDMEDDIPF